MHGTSILVFYRQGVTQTSATSIFGLFWQDVQCKSFKSALKIPVFPLTRTSQLFLAEPIIYPVLKKKMIRSSTDPDFKKNS